jgi:hypothetical protein
LSALSVSLTSFVAAIAVSSRGLNCVVSPAC